MRVSKEVMADHRVAILKAAASLLRSHGFEGVSVAEIMGKVGLTHGGFYGHFSSKEELIARALERLLVESTSKWEAVMEQAEGDPVEAFAKSYLSIRHFTAQDEGCLFPTLGADLARLPAEVRLNLERPLSSFFDRIGRFFRGRSAREKRHAAIATMASLIGAVVLSQIVEDDRLSTEILDSVSASLARQSVVTV